MLGFLALYCGLAYIFRSLFEGNIQWTCIVSPSTYANAGILHIYSLHCYVDTNFGRLAT